MGAHRRARVRGGGLGRRAGTIASENREAAVLTEMAVERDCFRDLEAFHHHKTQRSQRE